MLWATVVYTVRRWPERRYAAHTCTFHLIYKLQAVWDSRFRRDVAENFTVLGYYAASSGNFMPTFRDNLLVPSSGFTCLNREDGTDRLSWNVGKISPLLAE